MCFSFGKLSTPAFQVSGKSFEKNFTDIMKHYRNQPQATSHVYRSVLLAGKAAATSPQVGSIFTKYIDSPSTALNHRRQYHNPTPLQPPEDAPPALLWVRMGKNVEISSSSTMPSSFPLYRSMSDSNLQIVT